MCHDGGDLLYCCDRCPKVYHLACYIPPMMKEPEDNWVCKNVSSGDLNTGHLNTRLFSVWNLNGALNLPTKASKFGASFVMTLYLCSVGDYRRNITIIMGYIWEHDLIGSRRGLHLGLFNL